MTTTSKTKPQTMNEQIHEDFRQRLAATIYLSYPDSDLLPIEPPKLSGESIDSFEERMDKLEDGFGDTLFQFIIREMSDEGESPEELLKRLVKAQEDLGRVIKGVLTMLLEVRAKASRTKK